MQCELQSRPQLIVAAILWKSLLSKKMTAWRQRFLELKSVMDQSNKTLLLLSKVKYILYPGDLITARNDRLTPPQIDCQTERPWFYMALLYYKSCKTSG